MPANTDKMSLPYPEGSDPISVHTDLEALAEATDDNAVYIHGDTMDGQLRITPTAPASAPLELTAGVPGNTINFYNSDNPTVRTGWVGYGSNDPLQLGIANASPDGTVRLRANGNVEFTAGGTTSTPTTVIQANGRLLHGKSSGSGIDNSGVEMQTNGVVWSTTLDAGSVNMTQNHVGAAANNTEQFMSFRRGNVVQGNIVQNGATGIAFNTSSDYRLKNELGPVAEAVSRIQALRPIRFAWKEGGTESDGFLAHEVQAVVPEAVSGTKDAVATQEDVDRGLAGSVGDIIPQGIDQSKLVPLLVSALQDALRRIDALEAALA